MKRAMGLILAVLAFAVVVHADRIAYGSGEFAGRTGEDFWSQGSTSDALQSSHLLDEPGKIAFRAGTRFNGTDDAGRLTDGVFYSHFADSENTAEDPAKFDSIRRSLHGIPGDHDDGRGEHLGSEDRDPFHHLFGVQRVPELGTLTLIGVGFMALAVWKRRSALYADDSERVG
jgi:hypothetical protein